MKMTIESTEKEYLIKLPKENYDLQFISALKKRIQWEQGPQNSLDEDDLISRTLAYDHSTRFDHLGDK